MCLCFHAQLQRREEFGLGIIIKSLTMSLAITSPRRNTLCCRVLRCINVVASITYYNVSHRLHLGFEARRYTLVSPVFRRIASSMSICVFVTIITDSRQCVFVVPKKDVTNATQAIGIGTDTISCHYTYVIAYEQNTYIQIGWFVFLYFLELLLPCFSAGMACTADGSTITLNALIWKRALEAREFFICSN